MKYLTLGTYASKSRPDVEHHVTLSYFGIACSCEAFRFKRDVCPHLQDIASNLQEIRDEVTLMRDAPTQAGEIARWFNRVNSLKRGRDWQLRAREVRIFWNMKGVR